MPPAPTADGPKSRDMGDFQARRRRRLTTDHAIVEIAERQYGLISLNQLRQVGMSKDTIHRRLEAGRMHQVHQRVYSLGHSLLPSEGHWLAATMACAPDAVLSHRSALELWGVLTPKRREIDITAPNRRGRIPNEIRAHRHGSLLAADCTSLRNVPCTTVERSLLDFAGEAPTWELRQALVEAEVMRLLDRPKLHRLIRRCRGRRGVARLRLLLEELDPATKRTRSELERRFLRACVRADLPRPEVNVALEVEDGIAEADFLWRDARLVVEADSRRFHDTDSAFEHDRKREQVLQLAGWRVSRCTWKQLEREPRRVIDVVRGLLAQAPPQ